MKLRDAIEDFYADQHYKGNSSATVKHYRDTFEHYMKDTGVEDIKQFNAPSIRRWLSSHTELSHTTHVTYDRALRILARWLEANGYVAENPMKSLPKPKAKRQDIVTFTHDEIKAMLRQAKNPKRKRAAS